MKEENIGLLIALNIGIQVCAFIFIFLDEVFQEFFGNVCLIFLIRQIESKWTRNLVQTVFSVAFVGMLLFNMANFTFVRWEELEGLKRGDIIQCSRNAMLNSGWFEPAYYHYAIYAGDGQVIHAVVVDHNLTASIKFQSLEAAAAGFKCRVNNMEERARRKGVHRRTDAEIIACSYNRMLEDALDYNVLTNNCEHFATDCVYGSGFSSQSDFQETINYAIFTVVSTSLQILAVKIWGDEFIIFVVIWINKITSFLLNTSFIYLALFVIWVVFSGRITFANWDKVADYLFTFTPLEFSIVLFLVSSIMGTLVLLIDNLEHFIM